MLDQKTGQTHTSVLISVTILCTKSISLVSNPIATTTDYTINKSQLLTTTLSLPTYQPTPNNCAIGTLTFQVLAEPAGPLAPFITEYPTSKIDVATSDAAQAGAYDFRLRVTDSLTGIQNSVVSFHLDMLVITSFVLDVSTSIQDQVYKVSDPAIVLNVPQYLQTPTKATTKYFYSLVVPTPSFVTMIGPGDEIS